MAPQELVPHATQVALNVASYPMKGTAFYVAERYDKLVKEGVTKKKIDNVGPEYVLDLFPAADTPDWHHAERYILENNLFDLGAMRWRTCPDLTQQWHNNLEAEFCKFFNEVATACGRAMNANPPLRAWTANYSTTVLTGHEARRKPDLALIDFRTPADWRCVRSVGEMKSKRYTSTGFSEILNQNSVKASIIFASQDNRNFVLTLGFVKHDMVVYRFDRGGLMRTTQFSINSPTGWKYFARVAYFLAHCPADLLGYDESCHMAPHFPPRLMALQAPPASLRGTSRQPPREYKITMLLHVADNMFGRGSVVRRILHIDSLISFIAKDTWHNVSRKLTEGQILRIISGIDNIPKIQDEYVVGEDCYSSTAAARLGPLTKTEVSTALQSGLFQDRVHLRLIMEDASVKLITQFKTRAGLAQALLDCVKAHRDAYVWFSVLHRDIHIGNLYIKTDGSNGTLGQEIGGVLGDWGFADCQDLQKVEEGLSKHDRKGFPVPALTESRSSRDGADAPSSPSPSFASSLTPAPSSPPQRLPSLQSGTRRMQAAGRDVPNYREVTTDIDSDWDTKRATKSVYALRKNPWSAFNPWTRDVNIESVERTGNAAFVSVRLMLGGGQSGIEHGPRDDLESFFFVILIIMVVFQAPGVQRPAADFEALELEKMWWNPDQWASSAKWKLATMKLSGLWHDNIARLFSDYFKCWTESVEKLKDLIFSHYDANQRLLSQMCTTEGVTYEEVISVLQEMVKLGAEADAKGAEGDGQRSDAVSDTATDIASAESQHELLFSLAPAEGTPRTEGPHEQSDTSTVKENWYTPSEKFKITSVLTTVAATSEIPEGDVQPPSHYDLPHRDVISQMSRASAALTSAGTDDLPTNVSTYRQGTVDDDNSDATFPVDVAAPSAPGPSRAVSIPKRKASSAQDDIKPAKKSRTSERSKKTSRVAGLTKSRGGNSRKSRSHPEDDYVPPEKQGKRKSHA